MNIALIGSGGREHVLCQKIYESKTSKNILCIPGNAGTSKIAKNIDSRINNVLKHGQYILGPEVKELESELANYVNVEHCISCSSGTDALLMVLLANGIGPGDAVITTPFTYIATAEVIGLLGATPIFVDIDSSSFNISPELIEEYISKNTNLNI